MREQRRTAPYWKRSSVGMGHLHLNCMARVRADGPGVLGEGTEQPHDAPLLSVVDEGAFISQPVFPAHVVLSGPRRICGGALFACPVI